MDPTAFLAFGRFACIVNMVGQRQIMVAGLAQTFKLLGSWYFPFASHRRHHRPFPPQAGGIDASG